MLQIKNSTSFYNSSVYRKKQSVIAKSNWKKGVYNFKSRTEERECLKEGCNNVFEVQKSDKKRFCSHSCFAIANNSKRSGRNFNDHDKEKIKKLYEKGLSMFEVSEKLGCGYKKVVYCLEKLNVPRRSISEAVYLKNNPDGDPFSIKRELTPKEQKLFGLGIGIFWGEGNKASKYSVRLGNSDPKLIKVFRDFLIKICRVKKEKIKYSLLLFNDANKDKALKFWNRELGLKSRQIRSVTSLKPRGKGTYKNKSMTGVLLLDFDNTKLKKEIDKIIKEIT